MLQTSQSALSVQYGSVVHSTDVRREAFDRRYELIMPIEPIKDPSLCRDEFLRRLFADWDLPEFPDYGAYYNDDDDDNDDDDAHDRERDGYDEEGGEGDDGDAEQDKLAWEPLLNRIGSGSSIFSLAPNYAMKNQWSFSSFLRKMKRKAILSSLLRKISSFEFRGDIHRIHVITGDKNKYDKLLESMQRSSLFFTNSRSIYHLLILQRSPLLAGQLDINKIPHNLFSWSLEAFFKRREIKNFVYLDVLVRNNSWDTLEWAKYRCDLLETLRFFKFFYEEMIKGQGYRKLLSVLWEEKQMLTIDKSLERSIVEAREELVSATFKSKRFSQAWWDQYKKQLTVDVQRNLIDMAIRRPIEMRYLKSYYNSLVEMEDMRCNIRTKQLQKEVDNLKETMRVKNITSNSALNMYYTIIENYKERIKSFTKRLDQDLEHWEDQILMTSFRFSKAKDDLKESKDKLEFMHRRIAEVEAQIEAEELEEIDRLAREQEIRKQKISESKEAKRQKKLAKIRKAQAKTAAAVASRQKKVKSAEETT